MELDLLTEFSEEKKNAVTEVLECLQNFYEDRELRDIYKDYIKNRMNDMGNLVPSERLPLVQRLVRHMKGVSDNISVPEESFDIFASIGGEAFGEIVDNIFNEIENGDLHYAEIDEGNDSVKDTEFVEGNEIDEGNDTVEGNEIVEGTGFAAHSGNLENYLEQRRDSLSHSGTTSTFADSGSRSTEGTSSRASRGSASPKRIVATGSPRRNPESLPAVEETKEEIYAEQNEIDTLGADQDPFGPVAMAPATESSLAAASSRPAASASGAPVDASDTIVAAEFEKASSASAPAVESSGDPAKVAQIGDCKRNDAVAATDGLAPTNGSNCYTSCCTIH